MEGFTISKPCIFITSGGRTATRFFSEVLAESIPDCFSVQEPDVWRLDSLIDLKENWPMWFQKIRDFGFLNMTLGKVVSLGNPRGLSLERQRGKISEMDAARKLHQIRHRFISRQKKKVYVECNHQLAGLIDIIPRVFPNSKTIFIIRDGRDWVRSWFNGYFTPYGKRDPFYYLKSGRANARMFPGDPFYDSWGKLSSFQKVSWLWRFHIEYACKTIGKNPNAKIVHYEEIFSKTNQTEKIRDLLKYLTAFPDATQVDFNYEGRLNNVRFHPSRLNAFPKWENWTLHQVQEFNQICGDLLSQQGYGKEPEWQEMTAKIKPDSSIPAMSEKV